MGYTSTLEADTDRSLVPASLVCRVSSRTARYERTISNRKLVKMNLNEGAMFQFQQTAEFSSLGQMVLALESRND